MKISVIGTTKPNYTASKEELEIFSGHNAGVCYMPNSFDDLLNESKKKTQNRINQTKSSGHHSVYDHANISLYLEGIPKALAIVLNNEKQYTTSEKSGRYTKMSAVGHEKEIYDKWCEKFKVLIKNKYQEKCPTFFTDSRIEKLAQENARYLLSMFTPSTSMVYTTTYRQLNYLYHFMQKEIQKDDSTQNAFYKKLKPYFVEFCNIIKENTPYFDEKLNADSKSRTLSLMSYNTPVQEYFGDVYATSYKTSFACFAQAIRHRTISYTMNLLKNPEFYVPPILNNEKDLVKEWLNDCESQKDEFPTGMLINVNEMGTFDNFVLKMMERKCTFAQLEINNLTNEILAKYVAGLKATNHPRSKEMESYTKGSRCTFSNYTCLSPCGFVDGITETRLI